MSIAHWWPKLTQPTQEWLIRNNGDAVPPEAVAEIVQAGGPDTSDPWWVGQSGTSGFHVPDEAGDWIEAVGNGEVP